MLPRHCLDIGAGDAAQVRQVRSEGGKADDPAAGLKVRFGWKADIRALGSTGPAIVLRLLCRQVGALGVEVSRTRRCFGVGRCHVTRGTGARTRHVTPPGLNCSSTVPRRSEASARWINFVPNPAVVAGPTGGPPLSVHTNSI